MQSNVGIAIVLLIWTYKPVQNLSITIPRAGKFKKVTNIERRVPQATVAGDEMKISLPIKAVDILMIEP